MNMSCSEWLKVDALLQQKLKKLQDLDQEREMLIAKAEQQSGITPALKQELNQSLEKYEKLTSEIASLKETAKSLKAQNNQGC